MCPSAQITYLLIHKALSSTSLRHGRTLSACVKIHMQSIKPGIFTQCQHHGRTMGTSADVLPPNLYMAWSHSKERLNWHPPFWFSTLDSTWFQILNHYSDVIMSAMASQIRGVSVVCSIYYLGLEGHNTLKPVKSDQWILWSFKTNVLPWQGE